MTGKATIRSLTKQADKLLEKLSSVRLAGLVLRPPCVSEEEYAAQSLYPPEPFTGKLAGIIVRPPITKEMALEDLAHRKEARGKETERVTLKRDL
jgi:hypothetical protein